MGPDAGLLPFPAVQAWVIVAVLIFITLVLIRATALIPVLIPLIVFKFNMDISVNVPSSHGLGGVAAFTPVVLILVRSVLIRVAAFALDILDFVSWSLVFKILVVLVFIVALMLVVLVLVLVLVLAVLTLVLVIPIPAAPSILNNSPTAATKPHNPPAKAPRAAAAPAARPPAATAAIAQRDRGA
ncbi:hypothetical protein EWM64_g10172, partial [Hericium alpestre]